MMDYGIKAGLEISVNRQTVDVKDDVTEENFALGTLLSTASIANMVSEISFELLDSYIPEDHFSVGNIFKVTHKAPVITGSTVTLNIKVNEVENNTVRLVFIGYDGKGTFCEGTHERIIIDRNKLFDIAYDRAKE
jgi:fluoroacetyl-CoA thioesterase